MMSAIPPLSAVPVAPQTAGRRWLWLSRGAGVLLWLLIAGWLTFGAIWLSIHSFIVPRIGEWRPRLELVASRALGVPVRIGELTARSTGLVPAFELREVTLLDNQSRVALRLPRVLGTLSPRSLLSLGFEQLVVEQPELDIQRTADGKIYVGGVDVSIGLNSTATHTQAADWLFSQPELLLRGGHIRWRDALRAAPALDLTGVDLVLRNTANEHVVRLDASPPPGWGERFTARAVFRHPRLTGSAGDLSTWSGQVFAEFDQVDLSRLRDYAKLAALDPLTLDLQRGFGALRGWVDITRGHVFGATADVALQNVALRLGPALAPLSFVSVAGRVGGAQRPDGFSFSTEGLRFRTVDGLQWPGGNVALTYAKPQGDLAAQTDLKADRLDLAAVAQIARRLPLDPAVHRLVDSLAPTGLVESLQARWQGPLDAPLTYAAKGQVVGLQVAAQAQPSPRLAPNAAVAPLAALGRPGVSGATVDFDITQSGGRAAVAVNGGALELPGVFEEARIPLDSLSVDTQWTLEGSKLQVQLRNLQFANADAQGRAQVLWRSAELPPSPGPRGQSSGPAAAGQSSSIDVQGTLSRANGAQVHRYLPLVLPVKARHYVRDAIQQAQLTEVKFKVAGPVQKIPFTDASQGDFRISAKVQNGLLAYVPATLQPAGAVPWPALTDLTGELVMNHAALDIKGVTGHVQGSPNLQIVRGDARIADLTRNTTVDVNLALKGPLADGLRFVNTSPVSALTNEVLANATATGVADYRVKLNLPVNAIATSRIEGAVVMAGNDVRFMPGTPMLGQLRGTVAFSDRGFSVADAKARLLGGEARIDGSMRPGPRPAPGVADSDASVAFKAQGTLTADGLRQAVTRSAGGVQGSLAQLADSASGATAYTATLGFRRGAVEFDVASSLQGLALALPAPFGKSAESTLPLRLDKALLAESLGAGQKLQDQISLNLGGTNVAGGRVTGGAAAVTYVRDLSAGEPRVLRGALAVGAGTTDSVVLPDSGVSANINLPVVNLDAWERALAGAAPSPSVTGAFAVAGAETAPSTLPMQSYLPTTLAIRATELVAQGRRLNRVVLGGTREGTLWRANVDAAELNGYVEFRQPGRTGPTGPTGGLSGRLFARLARLNLANSAATEVEAVLSAQPTSIPALDIIVDDVEVQGRKLGRVEIEAVNRSAATSGTGVREWRLNKLNVSLPEARLMATGNWAALNAQADANVGSAGRPVTDRRRSVMNFTLDIVDSGELLRRFGMGDVIRRGKGKLEGQIAWTGSPLSLDYPTLSGQFNVNLASGQFLQAEPGLAKLLGVLSLQSLPRRLTLDFRDVFSEGFAFDFVRGDVTIEEGLARTNNLQMSGVNAAVLMEGRADIARETQSLRVVVVPEINAGTASLIASAINPVIGLGTFLAQAFLRRPLMQAATQEFQVDGTWADPRVTRVDRRAPAVEPAPVNPPTVQ